MKSLDRRSLLRGTAGIAICLPALEAMGRSRGDQAPMRMICIGLHLGLHGPAFFPKQVGERYLPTPLLEPIIEHRKQFTVFSGLDHPGVGKGHPATVNFLTGSDNPKKSQQPSLDQVVANAIGHQTQFRSLQLEARRNDQKGKYLSWNAKGVPLPQNSDPRDVFDRLFGQPANQSERSDVLANSRSILDHVLVDARQLQRKLGKADNRKLDEYLSAIRETEMDIQQAEKFSARPIDPIAKDLVIPDQQRLSIKESAGLMLKISALAFQADLTRVITLRLPGEQHNLSHHGNKQGKIKPLVALQKGYIKEVAQFLTNLSVAAEGGQKLLDRTIVLFGSGMGNASNHSTRNLPILVAGGGLPHGRHVAFKKNGPPLGNLYVSLLQQMGLTIDRFSSGRSTLSIR